MKKTFRIVSIVFLSLILLLFIGYLVMNEKLPEGEVTPEANLMAEKMTEALNISAWNDTKSVSWTFRGTHHYEWDREAHVVKVKWDDHEVMLSPRTQSGVVANSKNEYTAAQFDELVNTALEFFNNDSFWLYAPFKVFDPGVQRSVVTFKDGTKGLKVTYTSGGSTPGDSYVWILGDDYKPVAVKMWAAVLPIGGIEFSWENFEVLPSGAFLATEHKALGFLNINLTNLK